MYNVGDRVIVRDDLETKRYRMIDGPHAGLLVSATNPMLDYAGQEVEIIGVAGPGHWAEGAYFIDGNHFVWTDEMFSGLAGQAWDTLSIKDMAQLFQ